MPLRIEGALGVDDGANRIAEEGDLPPGVIVVHVSLRTGPDQMVVPSPPPTTPLVEVRATAVRRGRSCNCLAWVGRLLIWATRNNGH